MSGRDRCAARDLALTRALKDGIQSGATLLDDALRYPAGLLALPPVRLRVAE